MEASKKSQTQTDNNDHKMQRKKTTHKKRMEPQPEQGNPRMIGTTFLYLELV